MTDDVQRHASAAAAASIKRLNELLSSSTGIRETPKSEELPQDQRKKFLKNEDLSQDIQLKKLVAKVALGLMAAQILVADAVFVIYACFGMDWVIPDSVILGWLSATVVQVIGIVFVIASYLFPKRNGKLKK